MVKDYKWLVNLQSRTWRNFKHQNPMMKRTWKIHLSANYVTQSKSNLEASLENPVGLYFSDCFSPKFFLYSSIILTVMKKVEVGTLDSHELFEHRGVIYEVLYKTDYCVRCQYPNDKYRYRDKWKYLYTEFSLWTKVNKI